MPRSGNTTADGYGAAHQRLRAQWAPIVAAGQAMCWRCERLIAPGVAWDLGHADGDKTITRGPEHRHRTDSCPGNRSAGATWGNRARVRTPRDPQCMPRTQW